MKYPSHCCQKCGEFIGWLGRLLRFTHKCNKKEQSMNNQQNIITIQTGVGNQRVGTCSICGGDVVGFRGAWHGTIPPHPDRCVACGAVRSEDVIKMVPAQHRLLQSPTMFTTTTTTTEYK